MNSFGAVTTSTKLNEKVKKRILAKKNVIESTASEIERLCGVPYPPYYVDPTLYVSTSPSSTGELGILFARTIPLDIDERASILIQLSAPLVLYATRAVLRQVMAHEFLHYLELVRRFSGRDFVSDISSGSLFEQSYEDNTRILDPFLVFSKRSKLPKQLEENFAKGFTNEKLIEKCRHFWIEKGFPTEKISMGANQVQISIDSLARTNFEPKAVELLKKIGPLK